MGTEIIPCSEAETNFLAVSVPNSFMRYCILGFWGAVGKAQTK